MPKTKTTPRAKSMGGVKRRDPRQIVPSQFRKKTAVGTLMVIVRKVKAVPNNGLMPEVNMWWPQTICDRNRIVSIESTVAL